MCSPTDCRAEEEEEEVCVRRGERQESLTGSVASSSWAPQLAHTEWVSKHQLGFHHVH